MLFKPFTVEGILFEGAYTKESVLATINFQSRPDDIYITTYPRSGTTWTQNILIGAVYGTEMLTGAQTFDFHHLSPYLELVMNGLTGCDLANQTSRNPRLLKHHLPIHIAPTDILTKGPRNVLVFRNPKDAALSYFKLYQTGPNLRRHQSPTLEDFLDRFMVGRINYGSWWDWNKHWVDYGRANPETNLMIHYEDLKQDFTKEIRRLESFLNLAPMTSEAIDKLKALTSVESMKERLDTEKNYKGMGVVNKGEANRWKKEFPPEYVEKFDALTRETFGDDEIVAKFI